MQSLPDPLRQPPLHLPRRQQRVHQHPVIIARHIPRQPMRPRLRIHLDLRHMAPGGKHELIVRIDRLRIQRPRRQRLGQGRQRHPGPIPRNEPPLGIMHIQRCRLQQPRRLRPRNPQRRVDRHPQRRPSHHQRPRPPMPAPAQNHVAIRLHQPKSLHRQPELRRRNLRERGLQPLPIVLRPRQQIDPASRPKPHRRPLRRRPPRRLQKTRHTLPQQPPPSRRLRPPLREPGRMQRRRLDRLRKPPAIHRDPQRRNMRESPDHIPPPQLHPIDPHLPRRHIHQPLDQVIRLRLPRPPVSIDRHRMRERPPNIHEHRRHVIHTPHGRSRRVRMRPRPQRRNVSPQIAKTAHMQRQEPPLAIQRQPSRRQVVPPMRRRQKVLRPVRNPPDPAAQPPGRIKQRHILRMHDVLHPEPAAHVRTRHMDHLRRHPETQRQVPPQPMHILPAQLQPQPPRAGIVRSDRTPRFQRSRHHPVVLQRDRRHVRRPAERRRHGRLVPPLKPIRDIARRIRPNHRSRRRIHQPRDGRQDLVIHNHRLRRIPRSHQAIRNDQHHRLPHEPHMAISQRMPRRHDQRLHRRQHHRARHRRDAVAHQVRRGEHAQHPRHRPRSLGIDAPYRRMRMWRPHEHAMKRACHRHVLDIACVATQKPRVFQTADRAGIVGKSIHAAMLGQNHAVRLLASVSTLAPPAKAAKSRAPIGDQCLG